MANFSKANAQKYKEQVLGKDTETVGNKMAQHLADHFNSFNGLKHRRNDKDIETVLLRQREHDIELIDSEPTYPRDIVKFNPSGASKCNLELYHIAIGLEQINDDQFPYHDRWTRNASAVHEATQRDLLYAQKYLPNSKFTVEWVDELDLPAWEQNILQWKIFEHKGQRFVLNGMMDGILKYVPEDKRIGFEFKTKSSTIGQVGYYKMKDIQEGHKLQAVAYSLLFGLDEFVFMYESLAKDSWSKGADAKPDIRTFHIQVTEEMRQELLDKFAYVSHCVENGIEPAEELDKCFFCGFKYICHEGGQS